ncbi:GIY-YIG nuclease family protein [Salinibacter ruber]|uniref:GIY-YIG nuclease family protein n=1 Tax=Salinibacter ruber TaxID=146919 RepID=UPI00216AAC66|nr:GIY-YIG nuclease family protein [Salinibacter ruber]MCS3685793.1 hypothetical protein [Salinibacter ruber]
MSESNTRFLYVASPGGKKDESPCKIGISYNPRSRIYGIRANPFRSYDEKICLIKVYECKKWVSSTRSVENDYRSMLRDLTLPSAEEWFDFEAGLLVGELDNDERCSAVSPEEI